MSTATAEQAIAPAKGGKKKLVILIVAGLLLLVLGGGGAAMLLMKKSHADVEEEDDGGGGEATGHGDSTGVAKPMASHDAKHPPVFVPLDPFTVNLADTDAERYAQIGVTLEIDDAKTGEELKAYMPAIRNNILMVLSHHTAAQLLSLDGKQKLAREILQASLRPLGFKLDDEVDEAAAADEPPKKKRKQRKKPLYPIRAVQFSNFIVQ